MVEKTIALTGISANSIEDAVALAVARAGVTISGIHTAHVTDTSAVVGNWQQGGTLEGERAPDLRGQGSTARIAAFHAGGALPIRRYKGAPVGREERLN